MMKMHSPGDEGTVVWRSPSIGGKMDKTRMFPEKVADTLATLHKRILDVPGNRHRRRERETGAASLQ